ncbi:hypothetical protein PsYK624_018100 [Phanerochaete sordida]|uniref:Uncharacterized protein n=1 Tax=Phanerochaete sordida TaxID=48140 RepID=A0A9P3G004_9APHY|nr:hypothetical protein PsYK624_018100 [Phanerochaete sordida]
MSSIQRSKSAPLVAPPQPFLASRCDDDSALRAHRPRIVRHKTSLALTELSAPRSGYQTPRGERIDDPFSLGGFFPSHFAGVDSPSEMEWQWLREDDLHELPLEHTHEEDVAQVPSFDKAEDEETGRVIRREDKLGVLSLRAVFSSSEAAFTSPYDDHLLSPYTEDLPEDNDALYRTYCDLRRAYTVQTMGDGGWPATSPGELFSPAGDAADEAAGLEGERWWSGIPAGLGKVLEMMSL